MQLQCRKVVNVEEEGNWQFADAPQRKCFKVEWIYDIRECIFQFTAETTPIPRTPIPIIQAKINRETL